MLVFYFLLLSLLVLVLVLVSSGESDDESKPTKKSKQSANSQSAPPTAEKSPLEAQEAAPSRSAVPSMAEARILGVPDDTRRPILNVIDRSTIPQVLPEDGLKKMEFVPCFVDFPFPIFSFALNLLLFPGNSVCHPKTLQW